MSARPALQSTDIKVPIVAPPERVESSSALTAPLPDSKQAILDAAEEILGRAGYAGLSMRELSRVSGLAKSTLYHYFEDKHDIYLSVLERDMLALDESIKEAASIDGNPVERMRSVIKTYFRLLDERGDIAFQAIRRAGMLDEKLIDLFRRHRERAIGPIVEIIEQGIADGVFRSVDPHLTVMSIFGMVNGFCAQRTIFGETEPKLNGIDVQDNLIEHTLSLLLDGICT